MKKGQGRKDRDQRYYEANKAEINRRRRERRQRKKERTESGGPMLKLVENSDIANGVAEHRSTSSHQILHDAATDIPATDDAGSDYRASDQMQAWEGNSATNCEETNRDATNHERASNQKTIANCLGTEPGAAPTSNQGTSDQKVTDYEVRPAMMIRYDGTKNPPMENLRFQADSVYTFPYPSESTQGPASKFFGPMPLLAGFHLIVTLCLAALGTCLQFEFYREHDVLPGYAFPLAIAGAASMLALATVRFDGFRDWPRKLVYAAFYVFFVASSSYHVLSKTWHESAQQLTTRPATDTGTSVSKGRALEAMTNALEQATRNRAYKTMGILGTAVAEQVKPGTGITPAPEPAGIPRETVKWTGAVILIVLRALLEAAQAIGASALRGYFRAGKYGSRCPAATAD